MSKLKIDQEEFNRKAQHILYTVVRPQVERYEKAKAQQKNKMNEVQIFINRLKKIGIELELEGNAPWIYLKSVNGNKVRPEDYSANHGYTIAWYPVWHKDTIKLDSDLNRTFDIIRKYKG